MNEYTRRTFIKNSFVTLAVSNLITKNSMANVSDNLKYKINNEDILIIVDVQNDFCPGGSLAINEGDTIIPTINSLQKRFERVVLTADWHPKDHSSFTSSNPKLEAFSSIMMPYGKQIVWPPHCVIGTHGAKFHENLNVNKASLIIKKGFRKEVDSYSAFWENDKSTSTGLEGALKNLAIKRVFICGLALDYCVHYSAIDAAKIGFKVYVIGDATKPVGPTTSVQKTMNNFNQYKIKLIKSKQIS